MRTFTTILTDALKIIPEQNSQIDKNDWSGYRLLLDVMGMGGRNVLQFIKNSPTWKRAMKVSFEIPCRSLTMPGFSVVNTPNVTTISRHTVNSTQICLDIRTSVHFILFLMR